MTDADIDDLIELMSEAVQSIQDQPCSICGDVGYTLPCLKCHKLICPEHSYGAGFCAECEDARVIGKATRSRSEHVGE